MWYSFKKYFFDLNIDRETYVYFILVELKCGFLRIRNLTLHYYNAASGSSTKSKTVRATVGKDDWEKLTISGRKLDLHVEKDALNIFANFEDLEIDLTITPFLHVGSSNNFVIPLRNKRIEWFAVPLFMTGTGTITLDGVLVKAVQSPVYIDHVFSDILPFNMPVSKMFWGRILLPDMLVTYSVVITPEQKQWARCFVYRDGRQYYFTEMHYERIAGIAEGQEPDDDENVYQLQTSSGENSVEITIKHVKTAATGAFIDPERYRFKKAYQLLNKISNNPKGKKYLSEATMKLHLEGQQSRYEHLVCIDEYVIF